MEGAKPVDGSVGADERRVFRWEKSANGGGVRCEAVDLLNVGGRSEQRSARNEA